MKIQSSKTTDYRYLVEQLETNGKSKVRFVYRTKNSINSSGEKLGVFSGSFNPLTLAHLKIIELAEEKIDLKEVLLLLAKANVDKNVFGATLPQRLKVLKRYAQEKNNLSVAVSSHGRFIDKVTALSSLYPSDTQFYFIIGYDTLVRIFDSKYYTDMNKEVGNLFAQSEFIVANRGIHGIKAIETFLEKPFCREYIEKIHPVLLEEPYTRISSTKVRECVSSAISIDGLVPKLVSKWIEETGIYS